MVEGEFRPGASGSEWCDVEVLRRLRSRSLAALRHEVEPVDAATLGRFLPAWHNVGGPHSTFLRGLDGVAHVVDQLAGVPLPASAWESLILPARVRDYSPAMLDQLTTTGEVLWAGNGSLPGNDGWISLHLAENAPLTLALPDADLAASADLADTARRVRAGARRADRAGRRRRLLLPAAGCRDRQHGRRRPADRALGPGLGRPDHQRHVRAAARATSAAAAGPRPAPARLPRPDARGGCPGSPARRAPAAAGRCCPPPSRMRRCAPSPPPRRCSPGTAWSPAVRWRARASPAVSPWSTRC